jgi:sulfur relay protein TusB/DsrH
LKSLILINKIDIASLLLAKKLIGKNDQLSIILIQDAVFIAVRNNQYHETVEKILEKGVKFYLLATDVERRGIQHNLISGIELVDYDKLVDLLFIEDQKVVNF